MVPPPPLPTHTHPRPLHTLHEINFTPWFCGRIYHILRRPALIRARVLFKPLGILLSRLPLSCHVIPFALALETSVPQGALVALTAPCARPRSFSLARSFARPASLTACGGDGESSRPRAASSAAPTSRTRAATFRRGAATPRRKARPATTAARAPPPLAG